MMKKFCYILFASLLSLAGCNRLGEPEQLETVVPAGEKVEVSFKVAVPVDEMATKAMGNTPTIDADGFYVAVFGGSGYFNEWVQATVVSAASANYDGTASTVYSLKANLSVSDSRLRIHFIANCPTSVRANPPISGSQDTEENVLSQIRSQRTETYNDAYWQKVILPNGIKVNKVGSVYEPTAATLAQFPNPIVLVRNFARVYLRNLTPNVGEEGNKHQLVTIKKFALAYAPAEGVVAPILSAPYTSNNVGEPITVADNDETTPLYYENFFINYQNYPISSDDPSATLITSAPFNYVGYSPDNQSYDYYTASGHADPGIPLEEDMQTWDSTTPENNILYVYERTRPSASRRATRIIIKAERVGESGTSEGDKFYALDIVNTDGVAIPLLRNQTYTVHLINIEEGSGESDINNASTATSASVTGDPTYQSLVNISDGVSSIGASFTEKFYVAPQEDSVMFRYIPTNVTDDNYEANQEGNELVTLTVGSYNADTGDFSPLTPSEASSQGILTFKTEGGDYKVWIVKNGDDVVQYVRSDNSWKEATAAQLADSSVEKWGMVKFQLSESNLDSEGFFEYERTQAINILGSYDGRDMSRIVVIKTSPRQVIKVNCLNKYVLASSGQEQVVRVTIPAGLSRSMFPLDFFIEPNGYSLTPNGDALPVGYGNSIDPDNNGPAYYFVKSLTKADYDALSTFTANGLSWKSFDCHFKTTIAENACTVYVQNHYFRDDDAFDSFDNFQQRLFTNLSLPSTVMKKAGATFTCVLDYAHRTGPLVWWDPTNAFGQSTTAEQATEKGLSTTNRVLPPIITVTLNGLTPQTQEDGTTYVTTKLEHKSGNTYWYYVGSGAPTSDMVTVSMALVATGAVGGTASVEVSTVNITENPMLYASNSTSATIQGPEFTNLTFSPSTLALGLNKTTTFSFTYAEGLVVPITVYLDGLTLNGSDSRMVSNGDGTWTFTPTDENTRTYSISLKSTTRFTAGTVTLEQEDYSTAHATVNRSTSFTIPQNAIYIRGTGSGNPTNFSTNDTYVYLNYTTDYSYIDQSRYSGSYLNSSSQTVSLSNFTIKNDDATVYFIYRYRGWFSSTYYYATSTLSELLDATSSNRVTLHFSTTQP